ncbi:dTDP-4-dehydrorhamnose 3,5-epimerase family protein [Acuticoccus sp.]|uniref:dTDP-4-dehydrorhamnose 3,5-epimerase family protein n=1 Tax=Acuticoccus sp. TaxID=1904378 RepID=UPI003B52366F
MTNAPAVAPNDFVKDPAISRPVVAPTADLPSSTIEGVELTPIPPLADGRGRLVELLTQRDGPVPEIVHVYQVFAVSRSVRAWVYHEKQSDRLAFADGAFLVALFDIRDGSPTYGQLDVLHLGEAAPMRLHVPPYVVHGVQNVGDRDASFVNMPTVAYNPHDPDKRRIPHPDPRIPFTFEV